jgi:hypothetical protein
VKLNAIKETTFYQFILFIFFSVFLVNTFLLLVVSPFLVYKCKKTFEYSNITLIIIDIISLLVFCIFWKTAGRRLLKIIDQYGGRFILGGSIILFFGQMYVCYNIYFLTGWDAGSYVIPTAKMIAFGLPLDDVNAYFSTYPNNITLVWIFSVILKINSKFGVFGTGNELMSIIVVNCFISSLSGILTYKCVERLINSKWAIFSWIVYFLLVGTSPWGVITYSDPFALFLPILIFFLYTRDMTGKSIFLKWFLIGIIAFLGYYIKPQVIIILIAIVIIEIWKFFFLTKIEKKKKIAILLTLIIAFFSSSVINKAIYKQTGLNINKQQTYGWTHFAMMGLNTSVEGTYSHEDVLYSGSFATSSERKEANIKVIKDRLKSFSLSDLIKFISKKTLVNYGDGTFAWAEEGNFYMKTYEDKNSWISPLLKSFYYSNGDNYKKTSTFEQAVWIGIIVSMLGLILIDVHQMNNKIAVLLLSIIGLTAFELLFEARARYLYIYAPIYICLGILGLRCVALKVIKLKHKV